jgi:tRNA modification GTPase
VRAPVTWRGRDIELVDLAGLGEASGAVEREADRRARAELERASALLWLLPVNADDPARGVQEALLRSRDLPAKTCIVWSKADLGPPPACETTVEAVAVSGLTGQGISAILRWIERDVLAEIPAGADVTAVSVREGEALREAARILQRTRGDEAGEIIALEIRAALAHLDTAVGRTLPEAILDRIFSRFCVGK